MKSKITRLIKRIRDTQEVEIDCSACLDQISEYVDIELSTGKAEEQLPQVKHHLDQCGVCFEEYQVLRELARMEQEGHLPTSEDLISQLKKP